MASEEKKKASWFKSAVNNQLDNQGEQSENEVTVTVEEPTTTFNVIENSTMENNQALFSKENQDKTALDVIVSIENILKERQLLSYKNNALIDQVDAANETISRFKRESLKKDQLLQDKSKEIRELEHMLTNKQMSYDQLLEDYKEFQLTSNLEFDKISNQLETEKAKYAKLFEESTRIQSQQQDRINELEDRIRNLEIENEKFAEQYEKISNEKADLMKSINDFTERMSFSFSTKSNDTE